jgi:hypothetical protein
LSIAISCSVKRSRTALGTQFLHAHVKFHPQTPGINNLPPRFRTSPVRYWDCLYGSGQRPAPAENGNPVSC